MHAPLEVFAGEGVLGFFWGGEDRARKMMRGWENYFAPRVEIGLKRGKNNNNNNNKMSVV